MTFDWLPGKRYLLRELIPRTILLTFIFRCLLPIVPFHLFQFQGGWGIAAIFGLAFTIMFCVLGAYLMGAEAVGQFMEKHQKDWWFIPANIAFVIGAPALAVVLAAAILPSVFAVHSWLAVLAASLILNIACALTHDYKAS